MHGPVAHSSVSPSRAATTLRREAVSSLPARRTRIVSPVSVHGAARAVVPRGRDAVPGRGTSRSGTDCREPSLSATRRGASRPRATHGPRVSGVGEGSTTSGSQDRGPAPNIAAITHVNLTASTRKETARGHASDDLSTRPLSCPLDKERLTHLCITSHTSKYETLQATINNV